MDTSSKCLEESAVSYIIFFIWEVDFIEDLGAVYLDGVHLCQMGRTLPGLLTEGTNHSEM